MPEAGKSGESQNGFDSWIRPYVVESTLWPVLIVMLASLAAFVAPVVLFALRDRHIPAMAALTVLLVASGRAIGVDVAKRRVGLITGLVLAAWAMTGLFAYFAGRWHLI